MKLITAIIREKKLDMVREALIVVGISGITVSRVSGSGRQKKEELYRGLTITPNLIPKIKIEIAVNDDSVNITMDTIIKAARSKNGKDGEVGDGKIFIVPLEECIRIRTGESGDKAI